MAKIYGQLERAQIENLSADPSGAGLVPGRIWFNTTTLQVKLYNGTAVIVVFSSTAQTELYLGDPSTNGTWRLRVDSGSLKIEVRTAGSYVTKDTIDP